MCPVLMVFCIRGDLAGISLCTLLVYLKPDYRWRKGKHFFFVYRTFYFCVTVILLKFITVYPVWSRISSIIMCVEISTICDVICNNLPYGWPHIVFYTVTTASVDYITEVSINFSIYCHSWRHTGVYGQQDQRTTLRSLTGGLNMHN